MIFNKIITGFFIVTILSCNNSTTESGSTNIDSMHGDMDNMHTTAGSAIAPVPDIPENARVLFVNLKDGQTVSSTFLVVMGTENMSVDTANGKIKSGSGHHHILVDGPDSFTEGEVVPKDSVHIHFGNAQKETELTLTPGKHTLTLQFADALHRSYGNKLSNKISIIVKK